MQNRQVYVHENNRDDDTCAPGININRIAQNKNLTYFAVGFSVLSLTISKPLLEIRLESMQQTELRLKCLIIIGRWKVSLIVSPEKTAQIMSRNTWEFKTSLPKLDIIVHKMKSFDYKNPKKTDLRSSTDHFSVVRNTNIQFPCEMCRSHVFLLFVICINIRFFFFCVQLDPLFYILCVQKKNECVPGRNDAIWIHLCERHVCKLSIIGLEKLKIDKIKSML